MRYGLIGCGSMGSAIVTGACASGCLAPSDLHLLNRSADKADALADALGGCAHRDFGDLLDALEGDGVIILAVKPHQILDVVAELGNGIDGVSLVSVAAGIELSSLAQAAPRDHPFARAMPNVAASVGRSTTGLAFNDYVPQRHRQAVIDLFNGCGTTLVIDEEHFPAFSALAGCAPAWLSHLIDAFAQAGVAQGLTKSEATRAITGAMAGTAALMTDILDAGGNPHTLVDRVCSPGGTTVAGLLAGDDAGFSRAARAAVAAACARDRALSRATGAS